MKEVTTSDVRIAFCNYVQNNTFTYPGYEEVSGAFDKWFSRVEVQSSADTLSMLHDAIRDNYSDVEMIHTSDILGIISEVLSVAKEGL